MKYRNIKEIVWDTMVEKLLQNHELVVLRCHPNVYIIQSYTSTPVYIEVVRQGSHVITDTLSHISFNGK